MLSSSPTLDRILLFERCGAIENTQSLVGDYELYGSAIGLSNFIRRESTIASLVKIGPQML